jgi:hypothetical protein
MTRFGGTSTRLGTLARRTVSFLRFLPIFRLVTGFFCFGECSSKSGNCFLANFVTVDVLFVATFLLGA